VGILSSIVLLSSMSLPSKDYAPIISLLTSFLHALHVARVMISSRQSEEVNPSPGNRLVYRSPLIGIPNSILGHAPRAGQQRQHPIRQPYGPDPRLAERNRERMRQRKLGLVSSPREKIAEPDRHICTLAPASSPDQRFARLVQRLQKPRPLSGKPRFAVIMERLMRIGRG
jgi:hypothetical protein